MKQAAQVKREPVWWNSLEKRQISFVRKLLTTRNRVNLYSPSKTSSVSRLVHFHKMPIQMFQPIKGDRML